MEVLFLGTGTSTGVPQIFCDCEVCSSEDPKDNRLRSSVFIKTDGVSILIDCGPDFRQQILKYNFPEPDAILITHAHKDHVGGLDDTRQISNLTGKPVNVYANELAIMEIKKDLHYAFQGITYPGIPKINLFTVSDTDFFINEVKIVPIPVMHYKLPILGFRIGGFAYITDASFISEESMQLITGLDVLVINALRFKSHFAHFSVDDALQIIEKIKPSRAYLTHMGHSIGLYEKTSKILSPNVFLAYDGLKIDF